MQEQIKNQSHSVGVTYGLLSALLFGLSTPFAKVLVGTVEPMMLAGLLYLGSGLGLSVLWLFNRLRTPERFNPIKKKELPYLMGAIAFGGVLSPVLLMFGLSMTLGSTAALLLNLEGVLAAVLAWVFFKENYDRRIVFGMAAIALGGIALSVTGQGGFSLSWGCGLIVLSCLGWAIDNNLTRNVAHADAVQITLIKGLCAGSVNLTIALCLGGAIPSAVPVFAAMVVGFLGYGLSLVLFVLALRYLGTARTGAYFSTAPFVGAVAAILLLKEPVTLQLGLAAAFMAIGVWLHLTEHHEHVHEHEEMEHEHEHTHDDHHQHEHTHEDPIGEPHTHAHRHEKLIHSHPHYPDMHHRHEH
ncbi:MAG: DMT family transporter [Candidatus Melainabacteria bacterium]|nr:DMT family transporter [Candidatus Melainabacteria bacterium]